MNEPKNESYLHSLCNVLLLPVIVIKSQLPGTSAELGVFTIHVYEQ